MQRLAEEGWVIASHSGRFDLRAIGLELGLALQQGGRPHTRPPLAAFSIATSSTSVSSRALKTFSLHAAHRRTRASPTIASHGSLQGEAMRS
jgi:hypothetical protein